MEGCEGLAPDEVVKHHGGVGVVSTVMELSYHAARILKVLVLLFDLLNMLVILNPHGF